MLALLLPRRVKRAGTPPGADLALLARALLVLVLVLALALVRARARA